MAGVRQFDEGAALETALPLFWQKGFAATTMQDLAAATGIQRGSLYNAYGDKETLFLRVFDLYRERFLQQIRRSLDKPKVRDALQSFFDCVITSMTTTIAADAPTRGCLSTKTAVETQDMDAPIREAIQSLLDDFETILLERLSKVEKTAHLRIPAAEAARLVLTLTRGIVVIERVYQDPKRLRHTADSLIELLFDSRPRR
ncbi:helix-turn-helix transcriptional regulator [Paraburkholderia sp. Ac-20336]|uniref:TetR/AcrR family transcriptional regulator n=1 Tax=Burkholderiaceae TaxID=119060 RepID=UPI00141E343C|nr:MULTISPECIES: TetR/AcrR family transcriptional regulator [Burkholderiaceae]MBN3801539.1 helix-turn-helix transcriptional regulator [Paraburkholderia sp. Ac-20336]MBN3846622.1 helix-turn-helix transcriptional regulator [Paraburkholderia sp. Ac-20342]NIF55707.1 helix-turn-helix transcriptional regulator [Burkholderia sp. Ax-1724]NIF78030.1 helix-turn-helix transcriptional regulator [Paraburkholderia sp. Cy-641]